MSSYKAVGFGDDREWAVGSFVFGDAVIIIPINALQGLSNENIGEHVRTLQPLAVRALAEEIVDTWEYHMRAPLEWLDRMYGVLRPYVDEDPAIENACLRVDALRGRIRAREARRNGLDRKKRPGYVYLAFAETGHHKIGRSMDPKARIKIFDTKMPIRVDLVHVFQADDARAAELALHERFDDKREEGEWFRLNSLDVQSIKAISRYQNGQFV